MTPDQVYSNALKKLNTWIETHHKFRSPERETILRVVCGLKNPFTMAEVIEAAAAENICRATVYNAMKSFVEADILHCLKRQFGQKRDQYELLLNGKNIMQIICLRCGRVSEFRDLAVKNAVSLRKYSNFTPEHLSLYVYGTCKFCRKLQSSAEDDKK